MTSVNESAMPNKKFIFLDRDGTIIKDKHYMNRLEDIEFLPGAKEGLKKLQEEGYQFIIATNQAGIARGYFGEKEAFQFHNEVISRLQKWDIVITKSYFCFHHPDFTPPCQCRKPAMGMAEKARDEFGIDLEKSIFVGDKDSDIEFGKTCRGYTFRIISEEYPNNIKADYMVQDIFQVSTILTDEVFKI